MQTDYTSDIQPPKIPTSEDEAPKDNTTSSDDDRENSSALEDRKRDEQAPAGGSITDQLSDVVNRVVDKVKASESILVALSKDPSVDEISAAIGLTMILDKLSKHVTAIYSGATPNTLEFLRPDETFEKDTNSLQDFIIAINKEKADHLRYKIEGDYVKVYITPYRTVISEKDLEFDRGDYNVDLVITIDVDSGESIDGALAEYGRIMHDATAVNITTNPPGHFAETEWSDMAISSVCEMVVVLADKLGFKDYDAEISTALLTGIVAATNRFSNDRTASETMSIASRLMAAGADQQLISSNIMKAEDPNATVGSMSASAVSVSCEIDIPKDEEAPAPAVEPAVAPEVAAPEPAPAEPVTPVEPVAPAAPAPVAPAMPVQNPAENAAPVVPASMDEPAPTVQYTTPETIVPPLPAAPVAPEAPVPQIDFAVPTVAPTPEPVAPVAPVTPAMPEIPAAPAMPEISPAPVEIPPAPIAPPTPIAPAAPTAPVEPVVPTVPEAQPAPIEPIAPAAPQSYTAAPPDPAAFHIPGM